MVLSMWSGSISDICPHMDDTYEIERQAMNEAYERCCEHCNKKYWECCTGIRRSFGRVEGCNKVMEKYAERYAKWTDRINGY